MQSDQRPQLIWDLPLRLWHWALVVCLAGSWVTAEAGFDWTTTHFYFGYSALALVLFRLAWGVLGTFHSRYTSFLASPKQVLAYLRNKTPAKPTTGTQSDRWMVQHRHRATGWPSGHQWSIH